MVGQSSDEKEIDMNARITLLLLGPLSVAGLLAAHADVTVMGNRQTGTRDCGGGSANIAGNNADLKLRGCKTVTVVGNGNRLDVGYVETLSLLGSRNSVVWSPGPNGQRPTVSNVGKDNAITEISLSGGVSKTPSSGGVAVEAGGASVTLGAGGVTVGAGGSSVNVGAGGLTVGVDAKALLVNDDDLRRTYDCQGNTANVSGDRNELVLRNCAVLNISGEDNKIDAGTAGVINVSGDRNTVTWKPGAGGKAPRVADTGDGNRITQGN
jgi:hypothetical protein